MEKYFKVILDRFCDDVRSFDTVCSSTEKNKVIKAWWNPKTIELHIEFESGLKEVMNLNSALDFIGHCNYIECLD